MVATSSSSSTSASSPLLCLAPLSSPYALLPRTHTYALVVALLVPLPRGWLFRAALAALTTRCAVFAVDAAVILAQLMRRRREGGSGTHVGEHGELIVEPLPLDALSSLEMLALAVCVAAWLLFVSRTAARSSARALVRWWAVIVGIGAVLAFVAVKELGLAAQAALSDGAAQVGDVGERPVCEHGLWLPADAVFGLTTETMPALGTVGDKAAWFLRRIGIPALLFGALAMLSSLRPRPRKYRSWRGDDVEQNNSSSIYGVGESDSDGKDRGSWSVVSMALNAAFMLGIPAATVLVAVSAEQYYNRVVDIPGGLPAVEKITSVGQWGVWAATGVVVAATAMNGAMELIGFQKPFSTSTAPVATESDNGLTGGTQTGDMLKP